MTVEVRLVQYEPKPPDAQMLPRAVASTGRMGTMVVMANDWPDDWHPAEPAPDKWWTIALEAQE